MARVDISWKGIEGIVPLDGLTVPRLEVKPGRKAEKTYDRGGFMRLLGYFSGHAKEKDGEDELAPLLALSQKYPDNPTVQLKLAGMYQGKGLEDKAICKYLQAAEIFFQSNLFPQSIAVYKHVLLINPHLVQVTLKMAEIYRNMGQLEEAISQYKNVAKHYARWGRREKIPEITDIIQQLESQQKSEEKAQVAASVTNKMKAKESVPLVSPRTQRPKAEGETEAVDQGDKQPQGTFFDLGAELSGAVPMDVREIKEISTEKLFGFEEIFKELQEAVIPEEAYPEFHFQMGKVCREMGFTDGAIEQLQIALENGQRPIESARILSKCFREKGWFHEAQKYFEKAMQMEIDSRKRPGLRRELVMIHS